MKTTLLFSKILMSVLGIWTTVTCMQSVLTLMAASIVPATMDTWEMERLAVS